MQRQGYWELRQTIEFLSKTRAWGNISKDIGKINAYGKTLNPHGFIKDIEKGLEKFEALDMKKLST